MDIEILIDDKLYSSNLSKNLKKFYDFNCKIIESVDEYDTKNLLITDKSLSVLCLNLYNDKLKYQSIDKLKKLIDDKIKEKIDNDKVPIIISVLNLSRLTNSNPIVLDLYKCFSYKKNSLLVNFNYYHKYYNTDEITIDNLFLSLEDLPVSSNSFSNISYLSASKLPKEINKKDNYIKIINRLKKLKYDYIFIDITFDITDKNIFIIDNSDILIKYINFDADENYLGEIKPYMDKYFKDKKVYEIIENKRTLKINNLTEDEFFNSLEEFANKICKS